ncbi:hypothetical protein K501DRAFT_277208 [Backusella circina FSU 941]|nr:hypothetical protein K501DRAFT_277208 [Backusella circina FSU 941]
MESLTQSPPKNRTSISFKCRKVIPQYVSPYNTLSQSPQNIFHIPNQLQLLQKLTFLKSLELLLYPKLQYYIQDYASISVTKLAVDITTGIYSLGWILQMFPSLQELYINELCDTKIGTNAPIRIYLNLQILGISCSAEYPGLLEIVKIVVPNLHRLDMNSEFNMRMSVEYHFNIDLSNWGLNYCNLTFASKNSIFLPANYRTKHKMGTMRVDIMFNNETHFKIGGYLIKNSDNDIVIA